MYYVLYKDIIYEWFWLLVGYIYKNISQVESLIVLRIKVTEKIRRQKLLVDFVFKYQQNGSSKFQNGLSKLNSSKHTFVT